MAADPAVLALAQAATTRIDAAEERAERLELRVRAMEIELAQLRGASSVWTRAAPWMAIGVSSVGASIALASARGWI